MGNGQREWWLPVSHGSKSYSLIGKCIQCKCHQKVTVTAEEWANYNFRGMMIQDAFPNVSAGDREWLISGICGTCFDKLFAEPTDPSEEP